jgi:acyl phosphate:glycerol-3-phosphate acyltransferase
MLLIACAVLTAYLLGSLTFAVFVCKLLGLPDPRTYGSKNPGSSNVLRSGSKIAALLTLLLDALKGYIPVLLIQLYGANYGMAEGTMALAGLAAFFGHLYPVFFKFKGGKGVATAAGVIFAIHWPLGLATLGTWLIIAYFFRYSSLAALVSALFVPVYYLMGDGAAWNAETPIAMALVVMSAMLIYAHRANITRLLAGTESRLGKKVV